MAKNASVTIALALSITAAACSDKPAAPTSPTAASRPTSSLSGVVFSMGANGLVPVEGATVQVAGYATGTTNHDGTYRVSEIYSGSQTVTTSRGGYEPDTRSVTVSGDTTADIRLIQRLPYTLSGTVFESTPSGPQPIAGLEMYCDACGEVGHTRLYTDQNGRYTFTHVFNGRVAVLLSRGSYLNVHKDVTVNGDTRFDITLDPLP